MLFAVVGWEFLYRFWVNKTERNLFCTLEKWKNKGKDGEKVRQRKIKRKMTNDDGTMVESLHMATTNSICGEKCKYKNNSGQKRKQKKAATKLLWMKIWTEREKFLLNHLSQVQAKTKQQHAKWLNVLLYLSNIIFCSACAHFWV